METYRVLFIVLVSSWNDKLLSALELHAFTKEATSAYL
jgi:hypothetical protein